MQTEIFDRIQNLYNILKECDEAKRQEYKDFKDFKDNILKQTIYKHKDNKTIDFIVKEFNSLLAIDMSHKEKQLLQAAYIEFTGPKWADGFKSANPDFICQYRFWYPLRPLKRLIDQKLSHGCKKILPKEPLNPNNHEEKIKQKTYG